MGIHMTRGLFTAAALMVAALCTASPAAAQELQAKVPFDFAIGAAVLPAGDYTIEEAAEPALLAIRARDGKASAFVLTTPDRPVQGPSTPELVFVRVGDAYRLESIDMGDDLVRKVPVPPETKAATDRVAIRLQRERPTHAE
jgi:hypothetical protein